MKIKVFTQGYSLGYRGPDNADPIEYARVFVILVENSLRPL